MQTDWCIGLGKDTRKTIFRSNVMKNSGIFGSGKYHIKFGHFRESIM